jgi:ribosomal 50S subunit-recycling heat shock protein
LSLGHCCEYINIHELIDYSIKHIVSKRDSIVASRGCLLILYKIMLLVPLFLSFLAMGGKPQGGNGNSRSKALTKKISQGSLVGTSRVTTNVNEGGTVRVNKVLSEKYSRREADRLIAGGRVTVNGKVAVPGSAVKPSDFVKLDNKRVAFPPALLQTLGASEVTKARQVARTPSDRRAATAPLVYLVYHKPSGVECTTDQRVIGNVVDAVGHSSRIFPVGRLDKDTTGVLLMTNDGRVPNACLRAEHGHEKVSDNLIRMLHTPKASTQKTIT